ncbi:MAG: hypothetical protein MUC84_06025 [Solirubrobacteraceae bacterium]|jgi:hypothetical protein|nr:hypothetical protein [Solirubrobacteraceae bacterium]MCU0313603.1 hypothetical protein [Solirubrobacteraceae bacterium]
MPETRSPWRRAFSAPLLAAVAVLIAAGVAVLVLTGSNLGVGVGAGLLGVAAVVLVGAFFLAIGYGEDDERAREERRRRAGA